MQGLTRPQQIRKWTGGLLVWGIMALSLPSAWGLITGGEGNQPLGDPGWPEGAAAVFNTVLRGWERGNNAYRWAGETDVFEAQWDRTVAVDLTAQVRVVRACLPHLMASPHPRVVNIASTESILPGGGDVAYAAAKAGVVGMTRSLAVELGRHAVTVNCVCPGPIRTAMTDAIAEDAKQLYARRRVALRRYGDPQEVAHMTLSLVLPAARFTTGAVLVVDGGLTIRH